MAVKKIKTKNKVNINNVGEYYVARVIIKFIHNLNTNTTNPIYYDYAFDLIDVEVENENGEKELIVKEQIIKTFNQKTDFFNGDEVNYFFSLLENGVKNIDELQELLGNSLLNHTININWYNTTDWVLE